MGNEETNNKHFSNDDTAIASMKQSHTSDPNFPYTKHKRKGSDSNRISQEATTQYFNNLGHSQLHPQPQCPIQNKKDETTTSNNDEPNKQMTKVIMSDNIDEAAVALKNGGTVVFPTETVYGLGGDIQKVSGGIFIATPSSFDIAGDFLKDKSGIGLDWSMFK